MNKTVLLAGGLGFIGTNLANFLNKEGYKIIIVDKETYAANPKHLNFQPDKTFIRDLNRGIDDILFACKPQIIVNLSAESHVDNSIKNSFPFWESNVMGTVLLMEQVAKTIPTARLIHFATDECTGSYHRMYDVRNQQYKNNTVLDIVSNGYTEEQPYFFSSPYAASKICQEIAVRSAVMNHDLKNVTIIRPNNIFGPGQHVEKFIPTICTKALKNQQIPVYAAGKQIRPWLFVDDLCDAVHKLMQTSSKQLIYNIAADYRCENIKLVKAILTMLGKNDNLISFVEDRKNHDFEYKTDDSLFRKEFSWYPKTEFSDGLEKTLDYYKGMVNNEKMDS